MNLIQELISKPWVGSILDLEEPDPGGGDGVSGAERGAMGVPCLLPHCLESFEMSSTFSTSSSTIAEKSPCPNSCPNLRTSP